MRYNSCFLTCVLSGAFFLLVSCGESEENPPAGKKQKNETPSVQVKKTAEKPKVERDIEEGSLKIRSTSEAIKDTKKEVKFDPKALTILSKEESDAEYKQVVKSAKFRKFLASLRTKIPKNSLAEKMDGILLGKTAKWFPQQNQFGAVRIPCWALSPDRSVILLVETIGEEDGPHGSRLIFINTHTWKITAVFHLMQSDVSSAVILKDTRCVVTSKGQTKLKTADELQVIDLLTGEIIQSVKKPGINKIYRNPKDMLFATFQKDSKHAGEILIFESDTSRIRQCGEIRSSNPSPVLAFPEDQLTSLIAAGSTLEFFSGRKYKLYETVPLPEGFETSDILLLKSGAIVLAPQNDLLMNCISIRDQQSNSFGKPSAGKLLRIPGCNDTKFYSAELQKGMITEYNAATLDAQKQIIPEEARPRTTGNPMAIFLLPHLRNNFAVLDARGNFYLLFHDEKILGKKWQKEILITPRALPGKKFNN